MTQCPRYTVYANHLYYPFSIHNNLMKPRVGEIAEDILIFYSSVFQTLTTAIMLIGEFWELIPYILTLPRLLKCSIPGEAIV